MDKIQENNFTNYNTLSSIPLGPIKEIYLDMKPHKVCLAIKQLWT